MRGARRRDGARGRRSRLRGRRCARSAPLVEAVHEGRVLRPVGRVGPRARERPPEHLEARPRVEQPDEPRPAPGEVAREEERVVLADDAVARVRPVEPVNADADHRVVDGPSFSMASCGFERKPGDAVRASRRASERALDLRGGLEDARQRRARSAWRARRRARRGRPSSAWRGGSLRSEAPCTRTSRVAHARHSREGASRRGKGLTSEALRSHGGSLSRQPKRHGQFLQSGHLGSGKPNSAARDGKQRYKPGQAGPLRSRMPGPASAAHAGHVTRGRAATTYAVRRASRVLL